MQHKPEILLLGGDRRSEYLYKSLAERYGASVRAYGLAGAPAGDNWQNPVQRADVLVLPIPAQRGGYIPMAVPNAPQISLAQALACARADTRIIGGFQGGFAQDTRITDLLANEEFVQDNAHLTAQAAVGIALQRLPQGLQGATCLVTGYGRIAQALVKLLAAFGAQVWVAARRADARAAAQAAGVQAVDTAHLADILPDMQIVINTVPHPLLAAGQLEKLKSGAVLLELASPPYGIDIEAAQLLGLDAAVYAGLPGKMFPAAAAGCIEKQVIALLEG